MASYQPELPLRHIASRSSRTIKTGYQRFERPVYDYDTRYAPCRAHCPAGHDIAWAIHLASRGRFDLAREAFAEESPFPAITGRVCYHPCEGACNRADYDQPIAINALERAFAEHGAAAVPHAVASVYEESIGVVGAGPAGLTCAYHLVRLGYPVTVYDANPTPGGVLAHGIPAYRLPRAVVAAEIAALRAQGIVFRCGVRVGTDVSLAELRERHDALFLAPGLARPRSLSIPVPEDPRVEAAIRFLRAVAAGKERRFSGQVVVIGGGDVAIDAARSAVRLGAAKVILCCAEARTNMPAHPEEVDAARQEGIEILDRVAPESIQASDGGLHLSLVAVQHLRRGEDGSILFDVAAAERRVLKAAHVLYAVGQEADLSFLPAPHSRKRRLRVDAWGQTSVPGLFAGGDITGTYSVVNAISGGKRAAIGLDAFLRGLNLEDAEERIRVGPHGVVSMRAYLALRRGEPNPPITRPVRLQAINLDYFPPAARTPVSELGHSTRAASFAEVNLALSPEEAVAEAQRCFHCGTCTMCGNCFRYCPDSSVIQLEDWGFSIDLDHCKGCGVCVEECPRDAMSMTPEGELVREGSSR